MEEIFDSLETNLSSTSISKTPVNRLKRNLFQQHKKKVEFFEGPTQVLKISQDLPLKPIVLKPSQNSQNSQNTPTEKNYTIILPQPTNVSSASAMITVVQESEDDVRVPITATVPSSIPLFQGSIPMNPSSLTFQESNPIKNPLEPLSTLTSTKTNPMQPTHQNRYSTNPLQTLKRRRAESIEKIMMATSLQNNEKSSPVKKVSRINSSSPRSSAEVEPLSNQNSLVQIMERLDDLFAQQRTIMQQNQKILIMLNSFDGVPPPPAFIHTIEPMEAEFSNTNVMRPPSQKVQKNVSKPPKVTTTVETLPPPTLTTPKKERKTRKNQKQQQAETLSTSSSSLSFNLPQISTAPPPPPLPSSYSSTTTLEAQQRKNKYNSEQDQEARNSILYILKELGNTKKCVLCVQPIDSEIVLVNLFMVRFIMAHLAGLCYTESGSMAKIYNIFTSSLFGGGSKSIHENEELSNIAKTVWGLKKVKSGSTVMVVAVPISFFKNLSSSSPSDFPLPPETIQNVVTKLKLCEGDFMGLAKKFLRAEKAEKAEKGTKELSQTDATDSPQPQQPQHPDILFKRSSKTTTDAMLETQISIFSANAVNHSISLSPNYAGYTLGQGFDSKDQNISSTLKIALQPPGIPSFCQNL